MILNIIRTGELLGQSLAPAESISVSEYFEQSQKRIREHATTS